jgi:hypothetical protein
LWSAPAVHDQVASFATDKTAAESNCRPDIVPEVSGKFVTRQPKSLHAKLAERAKAERHFLLLVRNSPGICTAILGAFAADCYSISPLMPIALTQHGAYPICIATHLLL